MDKRRLTIGILCTILGLLAIIYIVITENKNFDDYVMSEELFTIKVTDVVETNIIGNVKSISKPLFRDTLIIFDIEFTSIDESITYNVQLSNLGNIDAVIDKINVDVDKESSIKYSIEGINENDKIEHNNSTSFSIKIDYISKTATNDKKDQVKVTLKIDCSEDMIATNNKK